MDHDHGDLARLVRTDQQQVGSLERLLGTEQAGPAVAIEIGPRPHVGQGRRQVDFECEHIRLFADRTRLGQDRCSQRVHSRPSLASTLVSLSREFGTRNAVKGKAISAG